METQTRFAEGFRAGAPPRLVGTHCIDEAHSNRHARLSHLHEDALELFFVYSGEGQYMVDGCTYQVKTGDMVICNARVLHGEEPHQKRRMRSYSIALTDVLVEGLPDNHLTGVDSDPVLYCGALAPQIGQMMRMIYLLYARQGHLELVCSHMAQAVLLLVFDFLQSRARHDQQRAGQTNNVLARRIQRYLDEHYREALNLQAVGQALHISEYYLAHVFREAMGMPPMQYVMKRRMGEAQTLLMDTHLPIGEIAERLGYENPWNFSTAFRKCVGMSPSGYRKAFQKMSDA